MIPLRFAVLGHPIAHSLSPVMHRAAFRALGLPHDYEAIDAPDEAALRARVDELRRGLLSGVNITVPHKVRAMSMVDEVAETAKEVGAANTIARSKNRLIAHNTDVSGLVAHLEALGLAKVDVACVVGAGGAAMAAVVALKKMGASQIALTSRSFTDPARIAASHPGERLSALGAELHPFLPADERGSFAGVARRADVVIQASSAGMRGIGSGESVARIIPWESLGSATWAYDLVYDPDETPFLRSARRAGLRAENGLGMLVYQGAHAFSLWLNLIPDVAAMQAAATSVISEVSI